MPASADTTLDANAKSLESTTDVNSDTTNLDETKTDQYQFVDCRASSAASHAVPSLVKQIIMGLTTFKSLPGSDAVATRALPTVLLYDEVGLDLFDRITYLPEYYLTNSEIDIFKTSAREIVAEIPNGSDVIELGCGSLRKTELLLDALDRHRTGVTYYAIDVMPRPLRESMAKLAARFSNISFCAMCGTYEEALPRLSKSTRPKTILWLGSSIGNYHSTEAAQFLAKISKTSLNVNDAILIGMDKQKQSSIIMDAYHDSQGLTDKFELNILPHTDRIVTEYAAQQSGEARGSFIDQKTLEKFKYVGFYDKDIGRHDSYLEACEDVVIRWPRSIAAQVKEICGSDSDIVIKRGERVYIESSYKYSDSAPDVLALVSGLTMSRIWTDPREYHMLSLFRKPQTAMPLMPQTVPISLDKWCVPMQRTHALRALSSSALLAEQFPTIPSISEWKGMWKTWDTLTLHIIPRSKLLNRPIDLRHPFIFYLGHIPAFADIHMSAAESTPLTEPAAFAEWFERGIDPNLEDPSICHSHSEVPDEWPAVDEILAYRDRVRTRIVSWLEIYFAANGRVSADEARHVWMAFEHEAMHIETLLYMVLQMDPTEICSPAMVSVPSASLAKPVRSWLSYAGGEGIQLGLLDDNESTLGASPLPAGHVLGWDNESPAMRVDIKPFKIQTQPITNSEYYTFLQSVVNKSFDSDRSVDDLLPRSWIALEGGSQELASDYGVRTVVGTPSIISTEASVWPVTVSQVQAEAYAKWQGKRLPTEAEWTHATRTYHLTRALASNDSQTSSAAADKPVEELLKELAAAHKIDGIKQLCEPYDLFIPSDANIGLSHWHPAPVPTSQSASSGVDSLPEAMFIGNAWEWTSTPFHPFNGFEPSHMYPGYSADFFDPPEMYKSDSCHYVIKGGSYITHPRMALRQTFRNWYQRGYPYMLATFRLCADS
ncbi:hypothetical protein LPJ78_000322 [Coemansia sp. RSA 989]|nr:hypothetical protein LPJ79_002680 [Coemansia sp. RSA 1821]KAJ1868194.1 hypothetical protein LPJ78_000322 [Coemansia sp. RSA 989]